MTSLLTSNRVKSHVLPGQNKALRIFTCTPLWIVLELAESIEQSSSHGTIRTSTPSALLIWNVDKRSISVVCGPLSDEVYYVFEISQSNSVIPLCILLILSVCFPAQVITYMTSFWRPLIRFHPKHSLSKICTTIPALNSFGNVLLIPSAWCL